MDVVQRGRRQKLPQNKIQAHWLCAASGRSERIRAIKQSVHSERPGRRSADRADPRRQRDCQPVRLRAGGAGLFG